MGGGGFVPCPAVPTLGFPRSAEENGPGPCALRRASRSAPGGQDHRAAPVDRASPGGAERGSLTDPPRAVRRAPIHGASGRSSLDHRPMVRANGVANDIQRGHEKRKAGLHHAGRGPEPPGLGAAAQGPRRPPCGQGHGNGQIRPRNRGGKGRPRGQDRDGRDRPAPKPSSAACSSTTCEGRRAGGAAIESFWKPFSASPAGTPARRRRRRSFSPRRARLSSPA